VSALRAPAFVALLVLPSACAYYPREDGDRLKDEVYALQTQVTALQQSLAELQENEKAQKEQLAVMTQELGELSKAARRNDADLGVQLDTMMQDVARMKGTVESFNERMSGLEASTSKTQEEVNLRFAGLDEKQKITQAVSEEDKKRAQEDADRRERLLNDPVSVFAEARKLINGGKAADARKLVRELILRKEGDKPFKKRMGEAQFLLGETYYAEGNWQQAAAEYNTVRKSYPDSDHVPDALFQLGMCFEKLKLIEDAKLFYQTVVQKHPKSEVAKEAKKRLKDLK
jgi:tol-pal system protein YbgF